MSLYMQQSPMAPSIPEAHQSSPPGYQELDTSSKTASYHTTMVQASTPTYSSTLSKPIVVPQITNIMFIKIFSPFSRCYPPCLAHLSNPISEQEFLDFIDGLNNAFLASTLGLAAHVAGGMMMGAQGVLPVQAVGGVIQLLSLAYTAGTSFIKVRSYLKKMNQTMFAPRGLVVRVVPTKKMMAAIGCSEEKIKLPPLENLEDLKLAAVTGQETGLEHEDPRLRRLRALDDSIAELTFDVPAKPPPSGFMQKMRERPLDWVNERQKKKSDKARLNAVKKHAKKNSISSSSDPTLPYPSYSMEGSNNFGSPSQRTTTRNSALTDADREAAMEEVRQAGGKKLEKLEKKEEKVANRILWVLITRLEGQITDDYLDVPEARESDDGRPVSM